MHRTQLKVERSLRLKKNGDLQTWFAKSKCASHTSAQIANVTETKKCWGKMSTLKNNNNKTMSILR